MSTSPRQATDLRLFLSYNRLDQKAVRSVCQHIEARGIRTFLDRDQLVDGLPWPQALEQALRSARAVAVFLGPQGLGLWQQREMFFALDLQVQAEREGRKFPVIPVLLRGAQPQTGFLFLNTWADFRDSAAHNEALERLIRSIELDERKSGHRETSDVCPYLGLRAFQEEDQSLYFGREKYVKMLIDKITYHKIVPVVGPSGSGKSSVVLAGLLPHLRRQKSPLAWDAISFAPREHPWWNLAYALVPLLEPDLSEAHRFERAGVLERALRNRNGALAGTFRRVLQISRGTDRLLVIVDQLEEMFTVAPGASDLGDENAQQEAEAWKLQRRGMLEDLLNAPDSVPVTIVLTLRADYYGHAQTNGKLADALNASQVALGPMLPDELRQAILGPAASAGLEFEPGLVTRILTDIGDEPGKLPLLEYALKRLWDKRKGNILTAQAYDDFRGVAGAVGDEANRAYNSLSLVEQNACRALFGRLVRASPAETEGADTRRRATREEIGEVGWRIALELAKPERRLLVVANDSKSTQETAEVAHEALIRNWNKLRDWVREDREFLLWRQQIEVLLSIWQTENGVGLLHGMALVDALKWRKLKGSDLNHREREFIARSVKAQKQSSWLRTAVLGLFLLALLGSPYWLKTQSQAAEAQKIVSAFSQGDWS